MPLYTEEFTEESDNTVNDIISKIQGLSDNLDRQELILLSVFNSSYNSPSETIEEETQLLENTNHITKSPFSPLSSKSSDYNSPKKPSNNPRSSKFSHSHRQLGSPTPKKTSFSPSESANINHQKQNLSPKGYHKSLNSNHSILSANQLDILKLKNLIEESNEDDISLSKIQEDINNAINNINSTESNIEKEREHRRRMSKSNLEESTSLFRNNSTSHFLDNSIHSLNKNMSMNSLSYSSPSQSKSIYPNNIQNLYEDFLPSNSPPINILMPKNFQPPAPTAFFNLPSSIQIPTKSSPQTVPLENEIENFNFNDQLVKKMMEDTSNELYETVEECSRMRKIIQNLMDESQNTLNMMSYKTINDPLTFDMLDSNILTSQISKEFNSPNREKKIEKIENDEFLYKENLLKNDINKVVNNEVPSDSSPESFEILITSENSDDKKKNELISNKIKKSKRNRKNNKYQQPFTSSIPVNNNYSLPNIEKNNLVPTNPPPLLIPQTSQSLSLVPSNTNPSLTLSTSTDTSQHKNITNSQISLTVGDKKNNKIVLDFNSSMEGQNSKLLGEIISSVVRNMNQIETPDENKKRQRKKLDDNPEIVEEINSTTSSPKSSKNTNNSSPIVPPSSIAIPQFPIQNQTELQNYLSSIKQNQQSQDLKTSIYSYPQESLSDDIYQSIQSTKDSLQRASDSLLKSKEIQSNSPRSNTNKFNQSNFSHSHIPINNNNIINSHTSTAPVSLSNPSFSSKPQPRANLSRISSNSIIEAPSPSKLNDKSQSNLFSSNNNNNVHNIYNQPQQILNNQNQQVNTNFNESYLNHQVNNQIQNQNFNTNLPSYGPTNPSFSHSSSAFSLNNKNFHKINYPTSSSSPSISNNNNINNNNDSNDFDDYLKILENLALKERIDQSSQMLIKNKCKLIYIYLSFLILSNP